MPNSEHNAPKNNVAQNNVGDKMPWPKFSWQSNSKLLRFLADGMTQEELGRRVGVTRQTIAAIEQGKYAPTLETAYRIAHVFNRPITDVFEVKLEA